LNELGAAGYDPVMVMISPGQIPAAGGLLRLERKKLADADLHDEHGLPA
jgi:hypothetical protein